MIGHLPPLVTVAQRTPIARPMKRLDPLRSAGPRSSSWDPSTSVVVRSPNKSLSYAIVGVGGFLGMGEHEIAVPVSKLTQQMGKIVLQIGRASCRERV